MTSLAVVLECEGLGQVRPSCRRRHILGSHDFFYPAALEKFGSVNVQEAYRGINGTLH